MREVFEHTADLGLRLKANTLPEVFVEAGHALFELLIENSEAILPTVTRTVQLKQSDLSLLLFDWLNELLYLFDAERLLFSRFTVSVVDGILSATISGEPLNEARHLLDHEVKAITYHQLKLETNSDGTWLGEVILDI